MILCINGCTLKEKGKTGMTRDKRILAAFVVAAFHSPYVAAGTLYKCVDSKGVAAYQETPCPKATSGARLGYVYQAAPAKNLGWAAQAGELAQQQQIREASYDAEKPRTVAPRYFAPSIQQVDTSSPSAFPRQPRSSSSPPHLPP